MEQNPAHAPFRVAYEIYANPRMRMLAHFEEYFNTVSHRRVTSEEEELEKQSVLQHLCENKPTPEELKVTYEADQNRYLLLKEYFKDKINKLNLIPPLIYFDDQNMRIDVGYGPKQFGFYFKDLDFFITKQKIKNPLHTGIKLMGHKIVNLNQSYVNFLEDEIKRLLHMAQEEFVKPLPLKPEVQLTPQCSDEAELLTQLLAVSEGVVIGEEHSASAPKLFMIKNMLHLRALGITQLYIEHLLYERHQDLLDRAELPAELILYLQKLDKERDLTGEGTFLNIIMAAKMAGIRVIAIDTEATYRMGSSNTMSELREDELNTINRFAIMNMQALERFKQYNHGEKYAFFIGSGHAATCYGVPGVSELLGCPSLVVHPYKEEEERLHGCLKKNEEFELEEDKYTMTLEFSYYRSANSTIFEQENSHHKRLRR